MRRAGWLLGTLVALLALGAAGCGGDGESAPPTTAVTETAPPPEDRPGDPEAQRTLDRFIRAAGRRDAAGTWALLDRASQARFGPTVAEWKAGSGGDLNRALGALARPGGEYRPVLARRISDRWSVAAVQGYVTFEEQQEWGAYAAVVTREGGEPRISLAGTVEFSPVVPEPELVAGSTPDMATELNASEPVLTTALWVDGVPHEGQLSPDGILLTGEVVAPLEPGRHTIVSYADTQSGAGANAWTFESR